MSKFKLDLSLENILNCAVYAIIGLLLVILQGGSLGILMTVVGALMIVLGVVDIIKNNDMTKGIIEAVVGVLIIVCGWLIADIVLLIFGIALIIKGVMEIVKCYNGRLSEIISPIITVVVGVLFVLARWTLLDLFCIISGIIFLINTILILFGKTMNF